MGVEELAQYLLRCAQEDAALPCRAAANDDDMSSRMAALEELQAVPYAPPPRVPRTDVASNEDLEELVSLALMSAHDAEDVSLQANEAARRTRRGVVLATALGMLSIVIATAGVIGGRLYGAPDDNTAEIARQVQALSKLQHHIDAQLADLHAGATVQEASIAAAHPAAPALLHPAALAPLKTIPVPVLPAKPAQPAIQRADAGAPTRTADLPRSDPPPVYEASTATYADYPAGADDYATAPPPPPSYAPSTGYERPWPHYRPQARRYYRTTVVLPRPVVYFMGTVRRDVGSLFR